MIASRKEEHVRLAVDADVGFRTRTNGLDEVELPYNALPEINFSEISTSATFFGKPLAVPLIISGMTGGYPDAERINGGLAECAAKVGLALGVGSMRAAIEDASLRTSFSVVREYSGTVPVISNIGGVQLATWLRDGSISDRIPEIVDLVGASVFGIHLNPLQELMQPEGEPRFRGVEEAIARAVEVSPVPVLVKEVGAGINGEVSARLIKAGVHAIDVGGAGGTSWAGVEILRRTDSESVEEYWDVGTQTAICLLDAAMLRSAFHTTDIHGQQPPATFPLIIASGGLNSGSQMARALALGADLCASARPILKTFESGGSAAVCALVERWTLDLRRWMFLTGSSTIEQLRTVLEGNE